MFNIVKCLHELSQPKSALELSALLSITPHELTALVNRVNQLEPHLIRSSENNLFYLAREFNWLDSTLLTENLYKMAKSDYQVLVLDEVVSSNTYVLEHIADLVDKSVIVAEYQSGGRGRYERLWQSKIAHDLTVSVLYYVPADMRYDLLPMVVAVALSRLFKRLRQKVQIKWPNDIFATNGAKIAGVLVESGTHSGQRFVVIGIGIDNIIGFERNHVLTELVNQLDNLLSEYQLFGFALLRREWLDNCMHYKEQVQIYQDGQMIDAGINTDITDSGQLVISGATGVHTYSSTNISLRFAAINSYNLLIDAGNSRIKFGLYKGQKLEKVYAVENTGDILDLHQLKNDLALLKIEKLQAQ